MFDQKTFEFHGRGVKDNITASIILVKYSCGTLQLRLNFNAAL